MLPISLLKKCFLSSGTFTFWEMLGLSWQMTWLKFIFLELCIVTFALTIEMLKVWNGLSCIYVRVTIHNTWNFFPLLSDFSSVLYACLVYRELSVTDCTVCPENLKIFDKNELLIPINLLLCTGKGLVVVCYDPTVSLICVYSHKH